MDAGKHPESVRYTKDNPPPRWGGMEKSLESPNKGIRITAISRLEIQALNSQSLEPLIRAMRDDLDKDVRVRAAQSLASAFSQGVNATTSPAQWAAVFDVLSDAIATGDEGLAREAMQAAYVLRRFKDRPGFERVVGRILDGMDSSDTAFRAECMSAFVRLLYGDRALMSRYVTPARRQSLSKAVLAGLKSDYGRYKVDAQDAAHMLDLKEAIPSLIEMVRTDPEDPLRSYAAYTLGEIGDASAIPALEQMAYTDPSVDGQGFRSNRERAWQAIRAIRERTGSR